MKFISPYMHEIGNQSPLIQARVVQAITDFIGEREIGKVLDIGVRSPLTQILEERFSAQIENTDIDLDTGHLSGRYDTLFCFEVLEHLFNPLHFLLEAYNILDYNGRLFLSTPKGKPHFLWFKHHFHEFHRRELLHLIERSGFKVVKMKYYRIYPLWKRLTGFRPFLRLFLERKCVMELKK